MRYVKISHSYVTPVPDDAPADPEFDTLANRAVSIMEEKIRGVNPNAKDMVSYWEVMPKEFAESELEGEISMHRGRSKFTDEELAHFSKEGISFVGDVMGGVGGVVNPHSEGVRFFPPDHPLYDAETRVIEEEAEVVKEDDEPKQLEP